ncbi:hypothetical protein [Bacillus sp. 37MA]|nr:hypothetical protein [Bacillus sp. 37MA]
MAKGYKLTWPGHPNNYDNGSSIDLKIYFSEPDDGMNYEET